MKRSIPGSGVTEIVTDIVDVIWRSCIVVACLIAYAGPARADCSTATMGDKPTGYIFFNADYDVLQVCHSDGRWLALGLIGEGPDCPNIGDTCDDGTIYAGLSPDGDVPMYTTAADAPSRMRWNDGSSDFVDTEMENCTGGSIIQYVAPSCRTGQANTALLVASTSNDDYPYQPALYCDDLNVHGHTDWYLPAILELYVLYTNRNIGDLDGTFSESSGANGSYWASSELNNSSAHFQHFSTPDRSPSAGSKTANLRVRCVRR